MASDVRCYREIEGNEDQEKALVSQIAEFQLCERSSHEDQSGWSVIHLHILVTEHVA